MISLPNKSHMPFYFEYEGKKLLYTACDKPSTIKIETIQDGKVVQREKTHNAWKLHLLDLETNQIRRIETFEAPGVIECSPAAYYNEKRQLYLSFILNKPESMTLMKMSLNSKDITVVAPRILYGFSTKTLFVHSLGRTGIIVQTTKEKQELTTNFDEILRITYVWPDEQKLIITGRKDNSFRSVLYHLRAGIIGEILTFKDEPVYKCTLMGSQVIHAKIIDEGFENRTLITEDYIIKTQTVISITNKYM